MFSGKIWQNIFNYICSDFYRFWRVLSSLKISWNHNNMFIIVLIFSWSFFSVSVFSEPRRFLNSSPLLWDFSFTLIPNYVLLNCFSQHNVSFDLFCFCYRQIVFHLRKNLVPNLSLSIFINCILIKNSVWSMAQWHVNTYYILFYAFTSTSSVTKD